MTQNATPLPPWTEELRERYLSGEASIFLLYGNVRDLYPWREADGSVRYLSLRAYLERFLGRSKEIVAYYNCSEGIEFPDRSHGARFKQVANARRAMDRKAEVDALPRSPADAMPLIEEVITNSERSAGVIIDYAETIVPAGDLSFMSEADKANLVSFQRWAQDPALLSSDNLVIMIAENLADMHRRVVATPQIIPIQVALPGEGGRESFILQHDLEQVQMEISPQDLAKHTAGLSLVQIRGLFRSARRSGESITFRTVSRRKKSIIEQECHGLVEFVDPNHDFSHVGGMERIKEDLMRIAASIRKGHRNRVPMGLIFVGPMGTGKTYLAEAFAAESGLTCLKFKNFRDKWVGSTEGNLEKILQVVEGLGYVLLIIDEADRSLSASGDSDGGTNSRVVARLKEFMSDTTHRGRIVILMMTNRPDKLDTDLKRPGRFDVKVPFFFPETVEERGLILAASARKNRLAFEEGTDLSPAAEATDGYSAAELEAVLLAAAGFASYDDREILAVEDLVRATEDVIPSRDVRMLQFMELLAVFEASARRMLPDRYSEMETDEVLRRLDIARAALGHRAM